MTMMNKHFVSALLLGAALIAGPASLPSPAAAAGEVSAYIGAAPTAFDTPEAAVQAFKEAVARDDLAAVSALLGLDPARVGKTEGIAGTLVQIGAAAAQRVQVVAHGDRQALELGRQLWPFPFPLVKAEDGKWSFDTVAGLEEIVNRRIGQNELTAIETARLYAEAQRNYAAEDRDDDGVLEYAQKLVSSDGRMDGLYWPLEQGDGESPVGAGIDLGALEKAKAGDGYFGYRFRILKRQGGNVAGGEYDYVINGNMIGGFALIAWPAPYARTGVATFVVNQAGIVYEKDFGPDTEKIVSGIRTLNPNAS